MKNSVLPKVTVALGTYNRSHYLGGAIQAILNQTYPDFKLVILDNASTDDTPQIVAKFQDPRICYIRHAVNIGGLANGRMAVDICETEYLIITHDDDRMKPEMLSKQVEILDKHPEVVLASCNMESIDENGDIINSNYLSQVSLSSDEVYNSFEYIKDFCNGRNIIACPTVMLRMSFMREHKLNSPLTAGPGADVALWCEMNVFKGDFYVISEPLFSYRIHAEQDSCVNEVEL